MTQKLWTIKPHTVYPMGGRLKVEFKAGSNQHRMRLDITQHEGQPNEITSRVTFLTGGEVIRIEKLTAGATGATQKR